MALEQRLDALGKLLEHGPDKRKHYVAVDGAANEPSPARRARESVLRERLHRMLGADLTAIPTVGVETALTVAAEVGADLSRFATAAHFCSWLGLAPGTRISGDKRLGGPPARQTNRVGQALRMAASTARNSKTAIGAAHHHALRDTPVMANKVVETLSRIYNAAENKGWLPVDSNPCREVVKYRERKRERFLTPDEFERLGQALDEATKSRRISAHAMAAIRLVMLTGCRKRDVLHLKWEDVDLEAAELSMPDTKTGRARSRSRPWRYGSYGTSHERRTVPGSSRGGLRGARCATSTRRGGPFAIWRGSRTFASTTAVTVSRRGHWRWDIACR